MILSTVKTIVPGVKRDFIFEVISPTSSFILQAESQVEKDRWVQIIQNAISSALSTGTPIKLAEEGGLKALSIGRPRSASLNSNTFPPLPNSNSNSSALNSS